MTRLASSNRRTDAWAWRWVGTALSFALFGIGGIVLRVLVLPVLCHWPGPPDERRFRARRAICKSFWAHVQFMARTGVLDYRFEGVERLGRPGQVIIANAQGIKVGSWKT